MTLIARFPCGQGFLFSKVHFAVSEHNHALPVVRSMSGQLDGKRSAFLVSPASMKRPRPVMKPQGSMNMGSSLGHPWQKNISVDCPMQSTLCVFPVMPRKSAAVTRSQEALLIAHRLSPLGGPKPYSIKPDQLKGQTDCPAPRQPASGTLH